MFSTMPSTGTRTCRNISSPLRASIRLTSCGVVTITAPDNGRGLRQRQLGVAGAGRQIDDQIIELAPVDVGQELLRGTVHHRPAPDDGLFRRHQKAHRHQLEAVAFERKRRGVLIDDFTDAHHDRHAGAVNVGVEQADCAAASGAGRARGWRPRSICRRRPCRWPRRSCS